MDLDFKDCLGRKKLCFISVEKRYFFPQDVLDEILNLMSQFLRVFLPIFALENNKGKRN